MPQRPVNRCTHRGRRAPVALLLLAIVVAGCGRIAAYDEWARNVCERNDAIDQRAKRILPRKDILADVQFVEKVDELVAAKTQLKDEVDAHQPPFSRAALRSKMSVALNNSIRYLRSLKAQYQVGQKEMAAVKDHDAARGRLDATVDDTIQELIGQRAAYRTDPREIMMKQQYDKLYAEVRAELGLPAIPFAL